MSSASLQWTAALTGLTGLGLGYLLHSFMASEESGRAAKRQRVEAPNAAESDSDEWDDPNGENLKMVLIVRTDPLGFKWSEKKQKKVPMKMEKGKQIAQCCHAAVGCYQRGMEQAPDVVRRWERSGCAKIALKLRTTDDGEKKLKATPPHPHVTRLASAAPPRGPAPPRLEASGPIQA